MDENCHVDVVHKAPSVEERQEQAAVRFRVMGMGCPNCVRRVRNGLLAVYGVISADIDLESGKAEVVFNPRLTGESALRQAVAAAGGDGRHEYRAFLIG
ncbi:MAG TPA: heavy-metal-associated domain-containing protein [Anaerolineales bacterium]|nr:heavy-metal-associated domain-containing protein [Anaerolineales bacterium]